MNLNDFVDRSQTGRMERFGGHTVHVQAMARNQQDETILLLLQGRSTDVRAAWAMFHEGTLRTYRDPYHRATGDVYVKPNPKTKLLGGDLEMLVAHVALFPATVAEWDGGHFYTFGPPHFGAMCRAGLPVPILPHWEPIMWEMVRSDSRLGSRLYRGWNCVVYQVTRDPALWLQAMAYPKWRKQFTYEEAPHGKTS